MGKGGENKNINLLNSELVESITNLISSTFAIENQDKIDITDIYKYYPETTPCLKELIGYLGEKTLGQMIYGIADKVVDTKMPGEVILVKKLYDFLSDKAQEFDMQLLEEREDLHKTISKSICKIFNIEKQESSGRIFSLLREKVHGKIKHSKKI